MRVRWEGLYWEMKETGTRAVALGGTIVSARVFLLRRDDEETEVFHDGKQWWTFNEDYPLVNEYWRVCMALNGGMEMFDL